MVSGDGGHSAPLARKRLVDDGAQAPGRGRDVLGREDRRDHGDAVGAGGDHRGGVRVVDAGDGADRELAAGKPRPERDAREAVEPDRGFGVRLARRRKHAADAGVVDRQAVELVRLRRGLDGEADDRLRPEQPARVGGMHVVLPDMDAVGLRRERHVDAVVDEERHARAGERRLKRAGARDEGARVRLLVAILDQRAAAGDRGRRERHGIAPAGSARVDDAVEAQVDGVHAIRARARRAAASSPCRASRNAGAKLPGPAAASAATSAATPTARSAAAAATNPSRSIAENAATSAVAAQPMAVTRAISGWPFAIATKRSPSVTQSVGPVSATVQPSAAA